MVGSRKKCCPNLKFATEPAYEKIVIYAEENGAISNNQQEWSFGNGATGQIGITLAEDWELYALGFHADVATAGAQATIEVRNNRIPSGLVQETFTGATNNLSDHVLIADPVAFAAGDVLGFRTVSVSGSLSDVRIAAYLRRKVADFVTDISLT